MESTIEKTIEFVKQKLKGAEAGHDWYHIERVWKLSKKIAKTENCDSEIVELGALFHDIADPKFYNGDESLAPKIASEFLRNCAYSEEKIEKVVFIINHISFKNRDNLPEEIPVELQIVQDADRIDAIGAIGIARSFNFGGFKNNLMYDPEVLPKIGMSKEEYKKSNGTTINHFYEKLLLLKNMMNTSAGKKMAEERHQYMLDFLDQFYKEWNVD
ncbi:HD domain-containing protein [Chryseobacterium sp. POL2]|uniref:HD domain-containing protein n=1 Tax=Chryseobacterium sp. POL2 TaxID=2713414 RepID=UPI0013E10072|nr:HD domain-containing protein [Chryseobacterium sp. POL2]QIG89437.1 HD domain-containing protein [Chryseobacterium sp. POL2]